MEQIKKLYRSQDNRVIAGVCGGLGEYFSIDPAIFRLIFVLLAIANGAGIIIYIIMAIVLPVEGSKGEAKKEAKAGEFAEDIKKNAQELAEELKSSSSILSDPRDIVGLFLIVLGFIFFIQMLFPGIRFLNWSFLWPAILIIIGLLIIASSKEKK